MSSLVCLGNPLLDIVVNGDDTLLKKYDMEPNNAILADDKHQPLYPEITKMDSVEYSAGGASQNAARITQKILNVPNSVAFMGAVGRDSFSEILQKKATEDGVNVRYQYVDKPTGSCAVILTNNGKNRSLCANLAASTGFTIDHIKIPENASIIEKADYYYGTGYFAVVSPDTLLEIASKATANNKLFMLNISAPYVCEFYKANIQPLLEFTDIVFCNETEAAAFSKAFDFETEDLEQIALKIAALPKKNADKKRLVIITHGENPVVLANGNTSQTFPVPRVPSEKIVDTNGAGDAFVGGFISQLMQNKPYDVCVKCGMWAAGEIIQQSGCSFDTDKTVKFSA